MIKRKYILDRFQAHLLKKYQSYCDRHNISDEIEHLITFIIDQELISEKNIKHFTVLQEFDDIYPHEDYHKTRTVNALADRFNLSERTVWGILKNGRN